MQETVVTANTSHAYFEVKPDSVTKPHVEAALLVLVSQFPGIVRGMVRQVSTREYAVRLFVVRAETRAETQSDEPTHTDAQKALQEAWFPVREVPYETDEARFGQCIGNPPVQWAALIERALISAHCDADLPATWRALTGRTAFETVPNTAPMQTIWAAIMAANTRALVVSKMAETGQLFGVLGAYTDKDGSRRVILQHASETLDISLARYLVDHAETYVLQP